LDITGSWRRGRVGDFAAEMERRLGLSREAIREAGACGDDYGVATHQEELEELLRVAGQHGLTVDPPTPGDTDTPEG
jgi:hypothetical protein